ncbi:MAG: protein translocase subunit SecF [Gammaproteobacteria bacterium]|nr:protein translocase subunit SecF [Gammaproteobacteria bacterium]MCZ6585394.1 protein translocase subunit SecF [Gammaproteobacteria bacterium]
MALFNQTPDFNFMGRRRVAAVVSAALILMSLGSIGVRGLNLGIDFTGGLMLEVGYAGPADLAEIRLALAEAGFATSLVQTFGTASDVLIRLPPQEDQDGGVIRDRVLNSLAERDPTVDVRRIDFVDSQVGEDLTEDGGLAMLIALILIFIYVMLRFRWKFAAGTITALIHDVIIVVGFFSVFGFSFDLTVLAAVLATIGYSLNDTIVVFDRIRENFRSMRRDSSERIINVSINQMLGRTIITSMTTLLVLSSLYFLGGESVSGFALALIVGVLVGTYSSIYIASASALALNVSPVDLLPPKREEIDSLP